MAAIPIEKMMTIGELATLAGVSSRTIRYYEELGILPEPERSSGGTRRYSHHYRFYVEGALALKEVGFSLDEVQLIGRIALGRQVGARQRARIAKIIAERMSVLEHKLRVLRRLHEVLEQERDGDARPWQLLARALVGSRQASG